MPELAEVQARIRAELLDPGRDGAGNPDDRLALGAILVADGLAPADRLAIYRRTFESTACRALSLAYPAVHRLVGADFFSDCALKFVRVTPPATACLDDYGSDFPGFLAAFAPARGLPWLADVARIEWGVNRVLHAEDLPALPAGDLAAVAPERQADIVFRPHPSVSLVRIGWPADAIWQAVLDEDDESLASLDPSPVALCLLIERHAGWVSLTRMSADEWDFADALFRGLPLGEAMGRAREIDPVAALAAHLVRGRFAGIHRFEGESS